MQSKKFSTIDEYHANFSKDVQQVLESLRQTIKKSAPKAEETISYNMPAFKLEGMLVFYAANKNHIGFYPTPSAIIAFKKELEKYETSKGAIQFPIDKKLPLTLIKSIVKFRVAENQEKARLKKKR